MQTSNIPRIFLNHKFHRRRPERSRGIY
jgi:hypothetical protein